MGSIIIYIWSLAGMAVSAEERALVCARAYVGAAGVKGAGALFGAKQPTIARGRGGKPYFSSIPNLHFSLSHSGDYCACAYYIQPIGLDLQIHAECRREAIARRCFHPDEYAYLQSGGFKDFFRVWATKESYVKYTGAGIAGGLDKFCVVCNGDLKNAMDGVEFYRAEEPEGYSLCLCAASIQEVRVECLSHL